ncbi:argonaute protein group [Planoprotostelium fungivorum]|uniref:Argonaute protein group n=1 Tax=Planoprotostelium fungivorum TaxID=1890364 RepID=A0A2P6NWU4_9EUKA|nr:argonaute protein group [Planoprotostelium fungivorum]
MSGRGRVTLNQVEVTTEDKEEVVTKEELIKNIVGAVEVVEVTMEVVEAAEATMEVVGVVDAEVNVRMIDDQSTDASPAPAIHIPNDRKMVLDTNMFAVDSKINMKDWLRYEVLIVNAFDEVEWKENNSRLLVYRLSRHLDKTIMAYDGRQLLLSRKAIVPVKELQVPQDFTKRSNKPSKPSRTEEMDQLLLTAMKADTDMMSFVIDGIDGRKYKLMLRRVEIGDTTDKQLLQIAIPWNLYTAAQANNSQALVKHSAVYLLNTRQPIGLRSLLLTGTFQSFREVQKGMYLNVDISYYISTWFGSLPEYLCLLSDLKPGSEWAGFISTDKKLQEYLNSKRGGLTGIACTINYSKHKFRLRGIDFSKTATTHTFDYDGKKISVSNYLKTKYNISLKFPNFGLAWTCKEGKENDPAYVPVECLSVTQTKYMQDLTSEERTAMIGATRLFPQQKITRIRENLKKLVENKAWSELQVGVAQEPGTTEALILQPQELTWGGNKSQALRDTDEERGWQLDRMIETKGTANQPIQWGIIYPTHFPFDDIRQYATTFVNRARDKGLHLIPAPVHQALTGNPGNPRDGDNSPAAYCHWLKFVASDKRNPKLILVMLADKGTEAYRRVKRVADTEIGRMTKCVVMDNEKKWSDMKVFDNILASINGKLDGKNWIISAGKMKSIDMDKYGKEGLCLMGMDICHGRTEDNAVSYAALCASYDEHYCKYYSRTQTLDGGREIIPEDIMKAMTSDVLQQYHAKRGKYPQNIMFYRDGVGEGQYSLVMEHEMRGIDAAVRDLYQMSKKPNITYIVVQKRNHLRSFLSVDGEAQNPPPGTFIYKDVVDRDTTNFYLYSHKAIQGTAKPTHYQVLKNEMNLTTEKLANFTYAIAHLHQGCTRPTSSPAPVIRAHKAALRAYTYFEGGNLHPKNADQSWML